MSKSTEVRILNPASGCGWTSHKNAEHYVQQGRARWRGAALEFIERDYRCVSTARSAASVRRVFIDGGLATLDQVKGLPVAGDAIRMLMERSRAMHRPGEACS